MEIREVDLTVYTFPVAKWMTFDEAALKRIWSSYSYSQGRVVRKPVNANPGLKVNRSINFPCIKMVFASYFLFGLRLFKVA